MAKRLASTLINMVLSLVLISVTMSAALAFVYLKTKDPIEAAAMKKELEAIREVLPEFNSDPVSDMIESNGIVIYPVTQNDESVGYAIKTYTDNGFGGRIELMAGFLPDGTIYGVSVLQHKETPGLGTKMTDPGFREQFIGKNPGNFSLQVKKDGGMVDAITAATISSRAYCDALQRAYNILIQDTSAVTDATTETNE
ncbi:MAG: RnfABCDGE type electron transport complex subunit G [Bacteroidales bacterium]|nr:RnfABCDGE type electron transport complex subunit G [Bacteroidales bacterium]